MKHTDIDLDRNEFTDFISKKGMKGLMKGISKHLGECKKEYDDTTKMLKASRMMARRQSLKDFMKSCMESKKKKAPPKPKGEGRSGVVHRRPIIKKRPKYMQGKPKNPNVDIEKEVIDTPIGHEVPVAPPTSAPPAARKKPTNQYILYGAIAVVGFVMVRKYFK